MRKFIKILIYIFAIIFLALLTAWIIDRKNAKDTGREVLSFREFINLSANRGLPDFGGNRGDGLIPDVPSDTETPPEDTENPSETTVEPGTRVSEFTNETQIPTGDDPLIDPGVDQTADPLDPTPDVDGEYDPDDDLADGGDSVVATEALPECSERDLNIEFTPEEIEKLQALEARFYAVSQYLHEDGDVNIERGNWSVFSVAGKRFTELNNYCQSVAYNINDPLLNHRVPTPFWRDESTPTKDMSGFVVRNLNSLTMGATINSNNEWVSGYGTILGNRSQDPEGSTLIILLNSFFSDTAETRANQLEEILRLNLW